MIFTILHTPPGLALSPSHESAPASFDFVEQDAVALPTFVQKVVAFVDMLLVRSSRSLLGGSVKSIVTIEKVHVLNVYSSFINIKAP